MAAFLLLQLAVPLLSSAGVGLRLDAYNNTALSGAATSTSTVASLGALVLPPVRPVPGSWVNTMRGAVGNKER